MNLIEEMRNTVAVMRFAWPGETDLTADAISDWADRLERSGALVPVPDGEACAAGDARGNHTFIMRGGDVFMSEPHLWDWVRIDGTYAELNDDIFVQPVRLAPIAEAGI